MIDMEISEIGLSMIQNFEGFSPIPYEDGAGNMTIGFGHKIRPGEKFTSVTEDQAQGILKMDLGFAESAVCQCVNVEINQNQYDALVSFTYNVGGGNLLKSTLLAKLNEGDMYSAADEFLKWDHIDHLLSNGLLNRRKIERSLFLQ